MTPFETSKRLVLGGGRAGCPVYALTHRLQMYTNYYPLQRNKDISFEVSTAAPATQKVLTHTFFASLHTFS